jgi:phenylacetate-coenzyme A ligase PaaK-like adenylate-forming protein
MFVVPRHIQNVIERYPELGRFQLVVDRPAHQDELTVKVALRQSADHKALGQRLRTEIREAIRLTPNIEFVAAEDIPEAAPVVADRRQLD